jgi:ADP-heptose:LPS heptosyltransferase
MDHFLVRTPDHLGDGVMALPAIRAISRVGTVHLVGPPWADRLYASIDCTPYADPNTAILFKPSFSAAWKVRHISRRVGHSGHWRRWLLTEALAPSDGHRTVEYTALAQAVNATVQGPPSFTTTPEEQREALRLVSDQSVLLLPLSKSQRTVGWPGFRALADAIGPRAVFAAGPGECEQLRSIAGPHQLLPPLDIGVFSAAAQRVAHVIGNDSGLAHLAAAARLSVERDPTTVHVVFGSTSPDRTGPLGCTPHQTTPLPCQPCYKKHCAIAAHPPCLEVEMVTIQEAVA